MGHSRGIEAALLEMEKEAPDHAALIAQLRAMAENFEFGALKEALSGADDHAG
jgi:hypothetical protein